MKGEGKDGEKHSNGPRGKEAKFMIFFFEFTAEHSPVMFIRVGCWVVGKGFDNIKSERVILINGIPIEVEIEHE